MKDRSVAITSKPASALVPPAGYDAKQLDPTLLGFIAACERACNLTDTLGPRVEATIRRVASAPEGLAFEEAELLTVMYDRIAKAALNAVRAVDELSRLRSFLAGGPDSRPDLSHRGEQELRAILLDACDKLGFDLVPRVAA